MVLAIGFNYSLYAQSTFAKATTLTASGLISDADPSGGLVCFNCSSGASNASWYSFTASSDGTIDLSACSLSGTDTRLWVYVGSFDALAPVAIDYGLRKAFNLSNQIF